MSLRRFEFPVLIFLAALCSYLYELLLAQTSTAVIGGLYLHYVLTFSIYILALGLGSLLPIPNNLANRYLVLTEVTISLIGGGSSLLLFWMFRQNYSSYELQALHLLLCFTIGILSGYELPLLYKINAGKNKEQATESVLSPDYLGMFAASLLFATYLLNQWGVQQSALAVGALNLLMALWLAFAKTRGQE